MLEENWELGEEIFISVYKIFFVFVRVWFFLNVVKGILMIFGYIVFGVFDVYIVVIVGFLIFVFFFVLFFEGWMIWLVVVIYFVFNGMYFYVIGILVYGVFLVLLMLDYIIRFMFVVRDIELDEILVFIGMVGGIWVMGFKGIIIGLIVLNVLLVFIKEWKKFIEFLY